jgi:hypothetical protein
MSGLRRPFRLNLRRTEQHSAPIAASRVSISKSIDGSSSVNPSSIHTHVECRWKRTPVYRFLVRRSYSKSLRKFLTEMYYSDQPKGGWVFEANISNPVKAGAGLNSPETLRSFVNVWDRRYGVQPRLAIFRLWSGPSVRKLRPISSAVGDGTWGTTPRGFFVAVGDKTELRAILTKCFGPGYRLGSLRGPQLSVKPLSVDGETAREMESLHFSAG